jgi:hypothetical protein
MSLESVHIPPLPPGDASRQLGESLTAHALDSTMIVSNDNPSLLGALDMISSVTKEPLRRLDHDQVVHVGRSSCHLCSQSVSNCYTSHLRYQRTLALNPAVPKAIRVEKRAESSL